MKKLFPVICAFSCLIAAQSFAGSATWSANPTSGDWNTAANWTPATVPNSPTDVATFGASNTTAIQTSATTTVDSMVFNLGADSYTITETLGYDFVFSGAGIVNNSGLPQTIVCDGGLSFQGLTASAGTNTFFTTVDHPAFGSELDFYGTCTAGEATFTNLGESSGSGYTQFFDQSSADHATLINNGAGPGDTIGGTTVFFDSSTSANAMIINSGGISPGLGGGITEWSNTGTAGEATVICEGGTGPNTCGGLADFFGGSPDNATLIAMPGTDGGQGGAIVFEIQTPASSARVELFGNGGMFLTRAPTPIEVGSIEGDGMILLNGGNLVVGNNNLSTVFAGPISGAGSFTKVGQGTLTLRGANSYSAGTAIEGGKLVINNRTGSGTGNGLVQVNAGRFGGRGITAGDVIVGTGSGSGAILAPGQYKGRQNTLTIQGAVTFNSDGVYECGVNTRSGITDKVVANGLAISGGRFVLRDPRGFTLPSGTVLTVVDNTSANGISGTFSNLSDGGTITFANNTFQANYEGGDGNDLTLTVVP